MTWIKIELHYFVKGKYSEMKYYFFPDKYFLVYFIQFRKKAKLNHLWSCWWNGICLFFCTFRLILSIYCTIIHLASGTHFQLKISLLWWLITHTNYCCSSGCTPFQRTGTANKCIITYCKIYYDYLYE